MLAQGLKNGPPIFQRVSEHVLQPVADVADPYFDDIIVGSSGDTYEAAVHAHDKDLRRTLDCLAKHRMVADPAKCRFFVEEVEFCGHILRGGTRRPSPGKLLAVQRWELHPTVTALRAFLGFGKLLQRLCANVRRLSGTPAGHAQRPEGGDEEGQPQGHPLV